VPHKVPGKVLSSVVLLFVRQKKLLLKPVRLLCSLGKPLVLPLLHHPLVQRRWRINAVRLPVSVIGLVVGKKCSVTSSVALPSVGIQLMLPLVAQ
jgi:hypothetical protein